jgi:hypothetical protein
MASITVKCPYCGTEKVTKAGKSPNRTCPFVASNMGEAVSEKNYMLFKNFSNAQSGCGALY